MRSLKVTCAIFGLCLLALCHSATAGSISLEEGVVALPTCAVRAAHAHVGTRDVRLTP